MGSHFMLNVRNKHTAERERLLAEGISEVVAELRLVEPADYVAFLRLDRFGNIADIVQSSAQLFLKVGTLRFANEGEAILLWGGPATIDLAMEFSHAGVTVHFRLSLTATQAAVSITYLAYPEGAGDPDAETEALREAIAKARLSRRA